MGFNSTEVAYQFGQHGSGHMKTATDLYPPAGKVIVAITMLEAVKFEATNGLVADETFKGGDVDSPYANTGGTAYFGTGTQLPANGIDDDNDAITSVAVANTVEFPKGVTVYGRWTRIALSTSYTHGVIVYYGPA
jgi:hypothetical protein